MTYDRFTSSGRKKELPVIEQGVITTVEDTAADVEPVIEINPRLTPTTVSAVVPHDVASDTGVPTEGKRCYFARRGDDRAVVIGIVANNHNGYDQQRRFDHPQTVSSITFTESGGVIAEADTRVHASHAENYPNASIQTSSAEFAVETIESIEVDGEGTISVSAQSIEATTASSLDLNSEFKGETRVPSPIQWDDTIYLHSSARSFETDTIEKITYDNGGGEQTIETKDITGVKHQKPYTFLSLLADAYIEADDDTSLQLGAGNGAVITTADDTKIEVGNGEKVKITADVNDNDKETVVTVGGGNGILINTEDETKVQIQNDQIVINDGSTPVVTDINTTTDSDGHVESVSTVTSNNILLP